MGSHKVEVKTGKVKAIWLFEKPQASPLSLRLLLKSLEAASPANRTVSFFLKPFIKTPVNGYPLILFLPYFSFVIPHFPLH